MMLFDTDDWIKRGLLIVGTLLVVGGIGAATWYNLNLKDEFVEGKTETNYLRQETSRLGANTDNLRDDLKGDIKKLLAMNSQLNELLKTKDQEYKTQFDKIFREQERLRIELKIEFDKLHASDKSLARDLAERESRLQLEIARLKDMNVVHSAINSQREREIAELNAKLQKEIDWRNKYYYNR